MTPLWVAVAGGVGALVRYELAGLVQTVARSPRPWGTLAVNGIGSLALGVVVGLGRGGSLPEPWLEVLAVGFLGGFTTFSTWMVETIHLAEEGGGSGIRTATANIVAMILAGLGGIAVGLGVAG